MEVVRKDIRNLHLAVYPPGGRIRVAVPLHVDDEAVRLSVISRLPWIHRQRAALERQERQSEREMVDGESHYFAGRRYRLAVVERDAPASVRVRNNSFLELSVRPRTDAEKRRAILDEWYRAQIREFVAPMVEEWQPVVGVTVAEWGIRKMRTRWGTCNIEDRRIWLNLDLAKKPVSCAEYILVHEMVHLLERHHDDRFRARMDQLMPDWRLRRDELNRMPLAHEDWPY